MQVLLCGFDDATTDHLSLALQEAGHGVLGATSEGSARSLIAAASPSVVFVPSAEGASQWLLELIPEVPVLLLEDGADPVEALPSDVAPAESSEQAASLSGPTEVISAEPDRGLALPAAAGPPEGIGRDGAAPELLTKLQQVRFSGYHEILEVEPGDTAYVIREQHDQLAVTYSSAGWPGPVSEEDVPLLDEIGEGIKEAYSVLGVPELRSAYEEALRRASVTV
ncbi:MAG: hypothetical protein VX938_12030 [Myxococcota bacterium]|nr:hypothetical protein [Myxococcota bacterium]MEE2779788.1 hypothetical protein [Myxococcota bacterium]